MGSKPRQRVGAIFGSKEGTKTVEFLGYGVYEGDFVPPAYAGGFAKMAREAKVPNPRIRLDNGDIVWGGECWWGFEEGVMAELTRLPKDWKVKTVRIKDLRAQERKALKGGKK